MGYLRIVIEVTCFLIAKHYNLTWLFWRIVILIFILQVTHGLLTFDYKKHYEDLGKNKHDDPTDGFNDDFNQRIQKT